MTTAIRRMLLILLVMVVFVMTACDDSVPHWQKNDGSDCYSTLQKGCTDALIWGQ